MCTGHGQVTVRVCKRMQTIPVGCWDRNVKESLHRPSMLDLEDFSIDHTPLSLNVHKLSLAIYPDT